jgi:hypothetical protein
MKITWKRLALLRKICNALKINSKVRYPYQVVGINGRKISSGLINSYLGIT